MTSQLQAPQTEYRQGKAQIYYEVTGSGEPLILIHGLCASRRWWRKNVQVLARHFRVYTVDLIGFGKSTSLMELAGKPGLDCFRI